MFKIIYPCGSEFTDKGVFLPKNALNPQEEEEGREEQEEAKRKQKLSPDRWSKTW